MRPLHLLGDIQARVQDYLVQVPHLICEPRLAIAALLGCAKLVLKERVVLRADNGKVVAHCADARSICEAALFPFPLFSVFAVLLLRELAIITILFICRGGNSHPNHPTNY